VPASPTQNVGRDAVTKALADLNTAAGKMTKNTYPPAAAQAWRTLSNNYDLMPENAAAMKAGNSDLTFTREVLAGLVLIVFARWTTDQQSGFRILLADFNAGRSGFKGSELSQKVEAAVGRAPSPFNP
jgi:hypothetical protein